MSYGLISPAILVFAKFLPNLFVKPLDLLDLSSLPIVFSLSIPYSTEGSRCSTRGLDSSIRNRPSQTSSSIPP